MSKITDRIASVPTDGSYFSLEFFPPKTTTGLNNLRSRLHRMAHALRPLFVTVTWGAGGSTASKSLELAQMCQDLGLTTCLHLTCTNMSKKLVDEALEKAKAMGIRNILALRGDKPREEYKDAVDNDEAEEEFVWAIDLVKYIRKQYGDYFCLGVAAYPEGHADVSHPTDQSLEHDLPYLVEKVQAGADFIMTQLFYDTEAYDTFEARLRTHDSGAFNSIPIIPGLMPIQSYQILKRTETLSHAKVPDEYMKRLDDVKNDDDIVKSIGVDILSEIVEKVRTTKSRTPGAKGFHFYTLNLEKAVTLILERTGLLPAATPKLEAAPGDEDYVLVNRKVLQPAFEEDSTVTRMSTLEISEGGGDRKEATWDDYPNGRWSSSASPAYGATDSYLFAPSSSLLPITSTSTWGTPTTPSDISTLFIAFLHGSLPSLPWSDESVTSETSLIISHLISLNKKNWWTLASQPAVNAVPSSDPVLGWGNEGGLCYQKAFVEMFVPAAQFAALQKCIDGTRNATYMATNARGEFKMSYHADACECNVVTWGVFPEGSPEGSPDGEGREKTVSPTVVEVESFRTWAVEAWGVWGQWAETMERLQKWESARFLKEMRESVWLVNVIWHDYKGMAQAGEARRRGEESEYKGLWQVLLECE